MNDDASKQGAEGDAKAEPDDESSAAKDLADGLELMMSAARKALRGIDPGRIEDLGRRAVHTVESLDVKQVSETARRAAQSLDPRKIEEIAQDAGRELLSVIERVSDRVEGVVGRRKRGPEDD